MYKISKNIIKQIIEHARKDAPVEACGYLAGNDFLIKKIYKMTNKDNSPEHYSFILEEQFSVVKEARKEGLDLIGVYHSHPSSPARLSKEDIGLAYDQEKIYFIISLSGNEPDFKAFTVKNKNVNEVAIKIFEETG